MAALDLTGRTALVTGASSGIGAEFARVLARRGARVVLVARREAALRELADELTRAGGSADVLPADLAKPGAGPGLVEAVERQGHHVDVLINNAGFGTWGDFATTAAERLDEEVTVNVSAVVSLTRAALPGMYERRFGAVVNVASTAAFQPIPGLAVYAATKAFVLSFSEALWGEARTRGVRVLALCPGATATEFFAIAGEQAQVGRAQTVEQVVAAAFRGLDGSRPSVISGVRNALLAEAVRLSPRRLAVTMAGRAVGYRGK